jgi:hypothetical protein
MLEPSTKPEVARMSEMHQHQYQLRFRSLFDSGRGFAFPCDADGQVDLGRLSERGRVAYLQAQSKVGRELATPAVERDLLN